MTAAESARLGLLGAALEAYLEHVHLSQLAASRAAVLAIHWHRALTSGNSPLRAAFDTAAEAGVMERLAGLLGTARRAGATVVYMRVCNPPATVRNNPIYWLAGQTGRLACGSDDSAVLDEVAPEPGDVVLEHHRMSAFSGSDLEIVLHDRSIDTLFLTGAATNIAVESTARDAADRGYRVVVIEDCCVAPGPAHEAALESMALIVTRIVTAAEASAALVGSG